MFIVFENRPQSIFGSARRGPRAATQLTLSVGQIDDSKLTVGWGNEAIPQTLELGVHLEANQIDLVIRSVHEPHPFDFPEPPPSRTAKSEGRVSSVRESERAPLEAAWERIRSCPPPSRPSPKTARI